MKNQFVPMIECKQEPQKDDLAFIIYNNKFIIKTIKDNVSLLTLSDIEVLNLTETPQYYLGTWGERHCFVYVLTQEIKLIQSYRFESIRNITNEFFIENYFNICAHALQIIEWDKSHQFCSCCGQTLIIEKKERAKLCKRCNTRYYPKICPAIIVAITKGDQILLAYNKNFPNGLHSLIAGFVEPGETLEDCVEREVFEEVGIRIKNIRYYQSQPWPFPNSLMFGFFAEYENGEITVDGVEIKNADWFNKDNLPTIPKITSIAGQMIRLFRDDKLEI